MMYLDLPRLYPAQLAIALDPHPRKCVNTGRQTGKTTMGAIIGADASWRGQRALWVSPTYKQSGIAFDLVKRLVGAIPGVTIRESDREVRMPSGGRFSSRSADEPNNLRGITGIDLLIGDEWAYCDPGLWDVLAPILLARSGKAILFSTPRAQNDHWHDLYRRAETDSDWASWTLSSDSNPFLPAGSVEKLRASMPAIVARREIDADFVGTEGALVQRSSLRLGVPPQCKVRTLAFDLAVGERTSNDFTAGVVCGRSDDGVVWVLHATRARLQFHDVLSLITRTAAAWNPNVVLIEDVAFQRNIITELQRSTGLNIKSVRPVGDKTSRFHPIAARIETGMIRFASDLPSWLLEEVCSVPHSKHDDGTDALQMAATAAMNSISLSDMPNRGRPILIHRSTENDCWGPGSGEGFSFPIGVIRR